MSGLIHSYPGTHVAHGPQITHPWARRHKAVEAIPQVRRWGDAVKFSHLPSTLRMGGIILGIEPGDPMTTASAIREPTRGPLTPAGSCPGDLCASPE